MGCADAETLARFQRGELSGEERGELLDHAGSCDACHAAIAVAVTEQPSNVSVPAAPLGVVPATIDRYTLGAVLGRGAMGVVYAARDAELGRDVALKLLRPLGSPERLRREAQALAKLAHPNVVRVYDIGEDAGHTFIAMELVDGEDLREWLASPRTVDEILLVLLAAGRGLAAAHAAGLVHRDFKPDNVLIASKGDVLVGDFGLARIAAPPSEERAPVATALAISTDELTATGAVVGTPAYMAPEQIEGEATAAADQYAFCVTAWEALYGRRPFEGATLAEVRANARAGRFASVDASKGALVPRRIEQALRRGLAEDAGARFSSMTALLHALSPRRSRRTWLVAGGAVLALAGGGAAWLALRAPAIDCAATASLIAPAWSPFVRGVLAGRFDERTAGPFAAYAETWQRERIGTCTAAQRQDQTGATIQRRISCLDRARASLQTTVSTLLLHGEELPQLDTLPESLPPVERCIGTQEPPAPPDKRRALDPLEQELTKIEVYLSGGAPSAELPEITALRVRAEQLGHVPTILRARMLEAQVAAWTGDTAAAEQMLRDVVVQAERANDDAARAMASARLAFRVARTHGDEAAQLIAAGRATLARIGGDALIDEALLAAEVELLEARGDLRGAAELEEKLVAKIEARLPVPTRTMLGAYNHLSRLWALAHEDDKSVAANRRSLELSAIVEPDADPQGLFRDLPGARARTGDFEGAIALGQRQLAVLRSSPEPPRKIIAYVLGQTASVHEWNLDYRRCADAYREAEQAWSLPLEVYRMADEPPNADEIALRKTDVVFSIGVCLLKDGATERALRELRRARDLAVAGGKATAEVLPLVDRNIGVALVELGNAKEGRALLEALLPSVPTATAAAYTRARVRFTLARALWLDGGSGDRPRARALAEDARRDVELGLASKETTTGLMRKFPAVFREMRTAIDAWIRQHPLD